MQIFGEKNPMSSQDWAELIHRVSVKRFPEAAELLLKTRGNEPNAKVVKVVASKLKTEWGSIYRIRRESAYSTKEVAHEVLENVEDWLDSLNS